MTPPTAAVSTSRFPTIVGTENGVQGLVIGVERRYFFYEGVTDDVRRAVEGVIETLRRLGVKIVEVELPELIGRPRS